MPISFIPIIVVALISVSCTKSDKNKEKSSSPQTSSLTEALKKKADASAAKAPQTVKDTMVKAIRELKESEVMKTALKKGDKVPEFNLPDVNKKNISSKELLSKSPLVIVFYRGGWCPYCNLQLRDLQKHLSDLKAAGAELITISPETPDATAETVKKQNLQFYVLSDADGSVGKKFGLMFKLNDDLKALYQKFGIDLSKANGNEKWELPLAATYVVKQNGEIVYSFVDADYKKRAETTDLIEIVKKL